MQSYSEYYFSELDPLAFEYLVADLLSVHLNLQVIYFGRSQDGGIDLLFSSNKENEIVGQVKRYANTNALKSALKKELVKLQEISPKPNGYIVATSAKLSPMDYAKIIKLFEVELNGTIYLSPDRDIKKKVSVFGNKELNRLLNDYPEVLKRHPSLWLKNVEIIGQILFHGVIERSKEFLDQAKININYFVKTDYFKRGLEGLERSNTLILTGAPGSGKSTLAWMMILELLIPKIFPNENSEVKDFDNRINEKRFELVYVYSIEEAENVLNTDKSSFGRQVIFIDDFLGSNNLEIKFSERKSRRIIDFIERIRRLNNVYLILTTRNYIFNQGKAENEELSRGLKDVESLEIGDYSKCEKAKILFKRLFHSELPLEDNFLTNQPGILKIIEHRNFGPRLIDDIIKFYERKLKNADRENIEPQKIDYLLNIFTSLDDPSGIWKTSYSETLTKEDRFFLAAVFSNGGRIKENEAEEYFRSIENYEIKNEGYERKHGSFGKSKKRLLGDYISTEVLSHVEYYKFRHPGINDFLIAYYNEEKGDKKRLFKSFCSSTQFDIFYPDTAKNRGKNYPLINEYEVVEFIESLVSVFNNEITQSEKETRLALQLAFFKKLIGLKENYKVNVDEKTENLLTSLNLNDFVSSKNFHFKDLFEILWEVREMDRTSSLIKSQWKEFILCLYSLCDPDLVKNDKKTSVVRNLNLTDPNEPFYPYLKDPSKTSSKDFPTPKKELPAQKRGYYRRKRLIFSFEIPEIPNLLALKLLFKEYQMDFDLFKNKHQNKIKSIFQKYSETLHSFYFDKPYDIFSKEDGISLTQNYLSEIQKLENVYGFEVQGSDLAEFSEEYWERIAENNSAAEYHQDELYEDYYINDHHERELTWKERQRLLDNDTNETIRRLFKNLGEI